MKISFLTILFSITIFYSSAQEVIGNVKRGPMLIAELSVKRLDTLNNYKLRFLDSSKEILKSVNFNCTEAELNSLYTLFQNKLLEKNGSSEDLLLGDLQFNLTTQKISGFSNILVTINESFSFGLSKKEIDRLFGK